MDGRKFSRFLRFFILALSVLVTACGPVTFQTESAPRPDENIFSNPPGEDCIDRIDPKACPLEGTSSLEGACDSAECSDAQISRYRGLILAFRARGTTLCVKKHNFFPNDTSCGLGNDDARLCTASKPNARDCVDAAAQVPVITVGVELESRFGHRRISKSEALVFSFRALVQSQCSGIRDRLRALPDAQSRRQKMNYFTDSYWAEVYAATAFGVIPLSEAATVDASTVSSSEMNGFLSTYKSATQGFSCDAIESWIQSH